MIRTALFTLCLAAGALAGCGDGGPVDPEPQLRYEAQVTGAISRTLKGTAAFSMGTAGYGGQMVALLLRTSPTEDLIVLEFGGGRPPVGTYPVVTSTEPLPGKWLGTYLARLGGGLATYYASEGEVRITESSATRLRGTFRFEAEAAQGEVGIPVQINVTGTFDAGPEPK